MSKYTPEHFETLTATKQVGGAPVPFTIHFTRTTYQDGHSSVDSNQNQLNNIFIGKQPFHEVKTLLEQTKIEDAVKLLESYGYQVSRLSR